MATFCSEDETIRRNDFNGLTLARLGPNFVLCQTDECLILDRRDLRVLQKLDCKEGSNPISIVRTVEFLKDDNGRDVFLATHFTGSGKINVFEKEQEW